jgi:endonuclease YncB( thermonuclease family)
MPSPHFAKPRGCPGARPATAWPAFTRRHFATNIRRGTTQGQAVRALTAVIILIAVTAASPGRAAEAIITDGDTLLLDGTPYLLDGIDAPKTDQVCLDASDAVWACGIAARDQLKKLVGTRSVRCEGKDYDTAYRNRRLGLCWVEGEAMSMNQWLVREGWAVSNEPAAKGRFKADEDDARNNGRGLWKGCFARPQERPSRATARLLGSTCGRIVTAKTRDILVPATPSMPAGCTIKGKFAVRAHVTGHIGIYHLESCRSYARTKGPDRWFCSEDEAQAQGFRKAFTC